MCSAVGVLFEGHGSRGAEPIDAAETHLLRLCGGSPGMEVWIQASGGGLPGQDKGTSRAPTAAGSGARAPGEEGIQIPHRW